MSAGTWTWTSVSRRLLSCRVSSVVATGAVLGLSVLVPAEPVTTALPAWIADLGVHEHLFGGGLQCAAWLASRAYRCVGAANDPWFEHGTLP